MKNCLLFGSNTTGVTSGGGTDHSSEVTRQVLLVEEELPTLQKQHDGCYWWRRNYPFFRSNTTGATSEEATAHPSQGTRRVLLVEEELSTLQK
jgi:hypothetical protein